MAFSFLFFHLPVNCSMSIYLIDSPFNIPACEVEPSKQQWHGEKLNLLLDILEPVLGSDEVQGLYERNQLGKTIGSSGRWLAIA